MKYLSALISFLCDQGGYIHERNRPATYVVRQFFTHGDMGERTKTQKKKHAILGTRWNTDVGNVREKRRGRKNYRTRPTTTTRTLFLFNVKNVRKNEKKNSGMRWPCQPSWKRKPHMQELFYRRGARRGRTWHTGREKKATVGIDAATAAVLCGVQIHTAHVGPLHMWETFQTLSKSGTIHSHAWPDDALATALLQCFALWLLVSCEITSTLTSNAGHIQDQTIRAPVQ